MVSDRFSFTASSFNGTQGGCGSIKEHVGFQEEHDTSRTELLGDMNPIPSNEKEKEPHLLIAQNQHQQLQNDFKLDNLMVEEFSFDPAPQTTQTQPFQDSDRGLLKNQAVGKTTTQLVGYINNNQVPPPSLASSLELLSNYGSRFKRLRGRNLSNSDKTWVSPQKLSTEEIFRVAGARYVQYSSQWQDNFCIPMHPYDQIGLTSLSEEENRDVELAQFLLAAAERVGCQQFERASALLLHCEWNSSVVGNPVRRVVFHFTQALRERIHKEIIGGGVVALKGSSLENQEKELIEKLQGEYNLAFICHQKIPFNQVMQFAGVQAMVEHVASRTKIHLIDLDIGYGLLSTVLMQALAERQDMPVELLKITAIGRGGKRELEEAGKRLVSFSKTLNLPFLYKAVFVTDIVELREDHFEIEDDEAVAIYSPYLLRTMVSNPDSLDNLMRVIRKIKPAIMIVVEVEANHNSPSFVNRFTEALFFFSAYFDCVDSCLKQEDECRMRLEAILSKGIHNILAMGDPERTVRNVRIDVWRRFFPRFRMVETGFSDSSLYQANLVVKKFGFGNFCTIEKNGKCLIIGWKGTPMHSISAWKFL